MTYEIDVTGVKKSGVDIARFDKSLASMVAKGHRAIRVSQNVFLRIREGREAGISQNGNYVSEGGIHLSGQPGIIVAESVYLSDPEMLQQAIQAHAQGRHFSTPDRSLYDRFRAIAEQDSSRPLRERRAIFMPSDNPFDISRSINREQFKFLLGEFGQRYFEFTEQDSLTYCPVSQETLRELPGTVPTQLWFTGTEAESELHGSSHELHAGGIYRVRGISQ